MSSRKVGAPLVIAGAFVVLMWAGGQVNPNALRSVRLERVVDGDTAYVYYHHPGEVLTKLRFLRIDTPERGERFYGEATRALAALLANRKLRLEFEKPGKYDTDRYGRALVYVYADEKCVNIEMVRLGWSKFYVKYGAGRLADKFRAAEAEARAARRGLWRN